MGRDKPDNYWGGKPDRVTMKGALGVGLACLVLVVALSSSGCSTPGPAGAVPEVTTPAELAGFVTHAAEYARSVGREAAIATFSQRTGPFSRGDLYIYAYDNNGTLLAHPYQEEAVGTNRLNWTDSRGLPVIRIGAHVAAHGGGFIAYLYPAPNLGPINESHRETYVPKIGYVCPAGGDLWVGSGLYFSDLAGMGPRGMPPAVEKMTDLVRQGAEFGRSHEDGEAFAAISNASGMFVDGEGHYLYAYDYNGTLRAHPHLREAIGTNLMARKDPFGMENIRALVETATSGGGFIVFVWPNPARGNRDELKIGYVLPVNDRWWVGSGVYLSEITGVDTSFPPP